MSLNIALLGLGQVGTHLAQVLSRENQNIVAVESHPGRCRAAEEDLDIKVLQRRERDRRVLEEAGIARADMMIAVTG
jgi:trk system potassium uptake protein TrkA